MITIFNLLSIHLSASIPNIDSYAQRVPMRCQNSRRDQLRNKYPLLV